MGGLFVLFLLGLYIWGAYKIVRWIRPVWGKALVVVAVLLIPTADAVYGRIKLKQMCEADGGLKVFRTAEGVEGFRVAHRPETEWLTKYGYKFVEGQDSAGKPMRLSLGPDGKIVEERDVQLKSRYGFEYSGRDFGAGYARGESVIRDLHTREVLARNLNFSYEGGWIERFVAGIVSAKAFSGACQSGANRIWPDQIVNQTLKPIR